jgi:hypothetical protein
MSFDILRTIDAAATAARNVSKAIHSFIQMQVKTVSTMLYCVICILNTRAKLEMARELHANSA